jgi:hypothetical protein
VFFRSRPAVAIPSERMVVPSPAHAVEPVPAGVAVATAPVGNGHTNGANGNGNGHAEPLWMQKLRAGNFQED